MKQILATVDSEDDQDQEQDEASSSSIPSVNLEFDNEDDCFGIFPPISKKEIITVSKSQRSQRQHHCTAKS